MNPTVSQSTPGSHPALRRVSQVYVEIPPSPYSRVREKAKHVSVSLKENTTPLQSKVTQRDVGEKFLDPSPSAQKRKMSTLSVVVNGQKKPKISPDGTGAKSTSSGKHDASKPDAQHSQNKDVPKESPNGYITCHHCRAKREPTVTIRCTVKIGSVVDGKERRCNATYCKPCLKKRYGEDAEAILAKGQRPSSRSTAHVQDASYTFQCPRCRGVCNCYRCRKGPAVKTRKKSETLPPPAWRWVNASLSLANAEARIQVREFVIRFRETMKSVTESYLEELDELVGVYQDEAEDEWVSDGCVKAVVIGLLQLIAQDEKDEIAQILNTSIKDIRRFSSKLDRVWSTLATLRDSLSASPALVAATFSRDLPLTFPDPSAPPAAFTSRITRSGLTQKVFVSITHSGQMLPVLVTLTNLAAQTKRIRECLDAAVKDAKEAVLEEREAHKRESDRFDSDKKAILSSPISLTCTEQERAAKVKTRQIVRDKVFRNLDCALKVMLSDYSLRAGPLGRDLDGRVYWAMSPGIEGRETAYRALMLEGGQEVEDRRGKKSGKGKKASRRTATDRQSMTEWSWFVAVWGRKSGAEPRSTDTEQLDEHMDGDVEDDAERWWGFCEPEEIKRLAAWISNQDGTQREALLETGLSGDDRNQTPIPDCLGPPTKAQVKNLVQALEDYAEVLQWLIEREEETNDFSEVSTGKRKGGPSGSRLDVVPTTNFYA